MLDYWAKNQIYGVDFKSGINTETAPSTLLISVLPGASGIFFLMRAGVLIMTYWL